MIASPDLLLFGGTADVPKEIAVCPECGGELYAQACEYETETGIPTECGIELSCEKDDEAMARWEKDKTGLPMSEFGVHRWWQSDWQPVIDAVTKWARSR